MQTFVLNLEKELIKKIKYSRSLPDLENPEQPSATMYFFFFFFFFLVFADFRTLRDNLGRLQLVDLKEKKVVGTG